MTRKVKEKKSAAPPRTIPLVQDRRIETTFYRDGLIGVTLYGCARFVTYRHDCVALMLHGSIVSITGEGLWCRTFGNRVAEVVGIVKHISFGEDES